MDNDYFQDDLQYFDKDLRIWRLEVCRGHIQKDLQYFDEMNIKCPSLCQVLEIGFGLPTADFGSVWSSQKARKFRHVPKALKV